MNELTEKLSNIKLNNSNIIYEVVFGKIVIPHEVFDASLNQEHINMIVSKIQSIIKKDNPIRVTTLCYVDDVYIENGIAKKKIYLESSEYNNNSIDYKVTAFKMTKLKRPPPSLVDDRKLHRFTIRQRKMLLKNNVLLEMNNNEEARSLKLYSKDLNELNVILNQII